LSSYLPYKRYQMKNFTLYSLLSFCFLMSASCQLAGNWAKQLTIGYNNSDCIGKGVVSIYQVEIRPEACQYTECTKKGDFYYIQYCYDDPVFLNTSGLSRVLTAPNNCNSTSSTLMVLPGACISFSGIYTMWSSCSAAGSIFVETFEDSSCTTRKSAAVVTESCSYHSDFQLHMVTSCPCDSTHKAQCESIVDSCKKQYTTSQAYKLCNCMYPSYINCLRQSVGCLTPANITSEEGKCNGLCYEEQCVWNTTSDYPSDPYFIAPNFITPTVQVTSFAASFAVTSIVLMITGAILLV
jgi:hypothetical protein